MRGNATVSLLNQYRAVLSDVQTLHHEAKQENWEALAECARRYQSSVDGLRGHPGYDTLDDNDNDERRTLLAAILEHDAAVRDLISPAQARIGALISRLNRQRKLLRSYGANGTVLMGAPPGSPR